MTAEELDATLQPLAGLRVVDLSTWIAGAYCTKLLADGGADVVKVEAPDGDPLRRWSASGATVDPELDGGLFNYLGARKSGVVVDPDDASAGDAIGDLLTAADAVVWSPGSALVDLPAIRPRALAAEHPDLRVVSITPFGLDTEWSDRPATEMTLQAWAGGVYRLQRGRPELPPTFVGGQVGEYLAGAFAAVGLLASERAGGPGELIDVSMLECLAGCLTYHPVTFQQQLGRPIREDRFVPTPGVSAASDGLVGLGTGTGQQWLDFCAMVGRPDWQDDPSYFVDRTSLAPEIDAWVAGHTVAEVLDLASAFRLPNAPIADGANVMEIEHFAVRDMFTENPRDGAVNPRPPCRVDGYRPPPATPAPAIGSQTVADVVGRWAATPPAGSPAAARRLPFEGLRVVDMTAFWAGPLTSHILAMLGAEVIHVESANRPDGARLVGGVAQTEDRWIERGPIFSSLNTNKSGLAIDLSDPEGSALLRRLIAASDVVVENYTPRVLDQLGLDHETLLAEHPELIVVRMPGFGLDGPWRDVAAFAFVIEDASGLTWMTGHPDAPPVEPYSLGDPNAGIHALYGLQLALARRDRTGRGGLVESSMVDAALNITAEQVIEYSRHGAVIGRDGNRGPTAAPQNLYPVAGPDEYGRDDRWVAIAVATDGQWESLRTALGDPGWAADPGLATAAGRRASHALIDDRLAEWCRSQSADDVVERLWAAGVPVAEAIQPHHQVDLPPLRRRGFFEEVEHPVSGRSSVATLPIRWSAGPDRLHRRPAPLLGEHTAEVLTGMGLTASEIDGLVERGVVSVGPQDDSG